MSTQITKNKKASFEYEFLEKYEAGIQLLGSEVKSIRENKCSINEAFCFIRGGELFIKSMHVAPYEHCGKVLNHDVLREKKLLLNKNEIRKLGKGMEVKGNTIIPTRIYVNAKGLIKLEIVLAKGKKLYDKRESIKSKDIDRDSQREIKGN
jgi:SsrA-binding protein